MILYHLSSVGLNVIHEMNVGIVDFDTDGASGIRLDRQRGSLGGGVLPLILAWFPYTQDYS